MLSILVHKSLKTKSLNLLRGSELFFSQTNARENKPHAAGNYRESTPLRVPAALCTLRSANVCVRVCVCVAKETVA